MMSLLSNVVTTAIDKISDGVLKKMDESEANRNREFSLKLKELEIYKGSYDEEIKRILDGWFDLLYILVAASNEGGSILEDYATPEMYRKLQIDTVKYGGTETGKALALFCQVSYQSSEEDCPKLASVYAVCFLLSTIKREILGQELTPETILRILLKDYDESWTVINESRAYVEGERVRMFPEGDNSGIVT